MTSLNNKPPGQIREELFVYARRNLALVNVYIRDPVVTRIKRDEKIPLIGFVANTGGLLGLTMGFRDIIQWIQWIENVLVTTHNTLKYLSQPLIAKFITAHICIFT